MNEETLILLQSIIDPLIDRIDALEALVKEAIDQTDTTVERFMDELLRAD